MSELQGEPVELENVTLNSVNTAAQIYAAPSGATLLVVGDLTKIESRMHQLNQEGFSLLDATGNTLRKERRSARLLTQRKRRSWREY